MSERSPTIVEAPCASVDLRDLSWPTRFVRDYCHAPEPLDPFFAQTLSSPDVWSRAIAARRTRPARPGTADIVVAQLSTRGAPTHACSNADSLCDPATLCVVTGQQAGLFGGPLYTLLKALTTIKLARRISEDQHVPVVPVFWVDADDHDLAEISTSSVLDAGSALRQVSVPQPDTAGLPASSWRLTDTVTDALTALRAILPNTEFSQPLLDRLAAAYRPATGIVTAFCRWLDEVLGPHGLVVFDASDPAAKSLAAPLFERELEKPGETSRMAGAAGARLTALGYHAQVAPMEHGVALFSLDGRRSPIRYDGADGDAVTINGTRVPRDELLARVRSKPETFSPNVLLRPIVQDALFPSIAYVAGPSELAYLGQLRDVYDAFDVPMPVIYPRATATIVDRATEKFLDRHDLVFADLQAQDDRVLNRLASALLPASVEGALTTTDQLVRDQLASLRTEVSAVDPTLAGAVDTTTGRITRDLGTLRGKVVQAAKRRDETLRRQFQRARAVAFPDGAPQERAVGFIYVLNRSGPHVVERLLTDLPLDIGQHWILQI